MRDLPLVTILMIKERSGTMTYMLLSVKNLHSKAVEETQIDLIRNLNVCHPANLDVSFA